MLSNFYNQTRAEYYRQLDAISQSKGNLIPFFEYALQGFVDGLREQILFIQRQQQEVIWTNHIHEQFKKEENNVGKRRRDLALAISKHYFEFEEPVTIKELLSRNVTVAITYPDKKRKTLSRDIQTLKIMNIMEEVEENALMPSINLLRSLHSDRI